MHPIFMETILILKIAYVFTVQKHTTLYLIVYSTAMTTLEALTGHINDILPLPGGSVVYCHHLATYRNANIFRDPYRFTPERWLDEEYAADLKHVLNPFSVGPRACLGKK
jgi:cytochrome P450